MPISKSDVHATEMIASWGDHEIASTKTVTKVAMIRMLQPV